MITYKPKSERKILFQKSKSIAYIILEIIDNRNSSEHT